MRLKPLSYDNFLGPQHYDNLLRTSSQPKQGAALADLSVLVII